MYLNEQQKELIEDFLSIRDSSQRGFIHDSIAKFHKYIFDTDNREQENMYDVYIEDFYRLLLVYKLTGKRNKHFNIGSMTVEPILVRLENLDSYHIYDLFIASKAISRVGDYKKSCRLANTIIEKSEIYKDDPLYRRIKVSTYTNVIISILNTKLLPEDTWKTDSEVEKVFIERVEMAKEYFSELNDIDDMLNFVQVLYHLGTEENSLSRFYLKAFKEVATEEYYEDFRSVYFDYLGYLEEVRKEREDRRRKEEYHYLTKNNKDLSKYLHALGSILTCKHTGTAKQVEFLVNDFSKKLDLTTEQLLYLSDMLEEEVSENKFLRKCFNTVFKFEHLKLPKI